MFDNLIILIACHFVGDFPFQSEFLALNKGKSWEINFYHAIVYTSAFILFAKVSVLFALILLLSHIVIDPLKARWGIVKHIWVDQLLHIGVIFLGLFLGV